MKNLSSSSSCECDAPVVAQKKNGQCNYNTTFKLLPHHQTIIESIVAKLVYNLQNENMQAAAIFLEG